MLLLKSIHKKTVFLLVLLYLICVFAIGFHHHDAARDYQHSDCPFCVAASIFSAGTAENTDSIVPYLAISYHNQPEETSHAVLSIFPTYSTRAPPRTLTA
jgi:hypothetical protein